jgi:hypothetical protein
VAAFHSASTQPREEFELPSSCALSLSKRAQLQRFDKRRPELVEGLSAHSLAPLVDLGVSDGATGNMPP